MARPLRVEFAGAFYHVINRGNAGENIFIDNREREKFYEYLEKAVERYGIKIHTYCLMTNHYHLLVETPHPNLSQAIKWLNVSYANYFNRKRDRIGHLFQGRFKSIIVDADEYLKPLSRYIHLNPLRAGMVKSLDAYQWSSYPSFVGKRKPEPWLEDKWLLTLFGKQRKTAEKKYRRYVEQVKLANIKNPSDQVIGGLILGEAPFANWIKDTFLTKKERKKDIPQLKILKPMVQPDKVVQEVAREFKCDTDQIIMKGQKKNVARDIAIYLARDLTGQSGVKLGGYFGGITGAGITVRYNQLEQKLVKNRRLKGRINRIKKRP